MKQYLKKALLLFSSASVMTIPLLLGGCQEKTQAVGPQFLLGIDKEIEIGDSIVLEEYINYVTDGGYSIVITTSEGYFCDVTNKKAWAPEVPGTYTITYTVTGGVNEGVNAFDLVVGVPELTWEYTFVNKIYDTGEDLVFEDYFDQMNISAASYYPWKMVMDSVTVGDETTVLSEETSWTFTQAIPHVFEFHIETEDGQRRGLSQFINVRYVDGEMLEWMQTNNVTVTSALRLENGGKVVLDAGEHDAGNTHQPDTAKKRFLPHIAFNGEYGVNDFVVVDFTGNNMPHILFFGEDITDTLWYDANATNEQNKGFVLANGWTTNKGVPAESWHKPNSINARLCLYGPNKAYKMGETGDGHFRKKFSTEPNPASLYTLMQEQNANTKYRIIAGFTEATPTQLTISFYMMNRETGEVVYEDALIVANTSMQGNSEGTVQFTEDQFKGKIALYGMFGRAITLDKIYTIEEDTTLSELKIKYLESPYAWMKANKVTSYNILYTDDTQKVVLAASMHNGSTTQGPDTIKTRDMSYLVFNGKYGLNDFVVFDFTGNNMPILSFFNDEVTNTIYYKDTASASQNKGLIIINGGGALTGAPAPNWNKPGSVNDRLQLCGPNKANKVGETLDGWFRRNIMGNGCPIGMYTLSQEENVNRRYRVIIGFTAGDSTGCTIALHVIDLDTGATVCSAETSISETFEEGAFSGNIALYSNFGKDLVLDALYGVEQDTTMEALKTKYAVKA